MHKAFSMLKEANHIVFASHINPDADALGSAIGFMLSVDAKNKKRSLFNASGAPESLMWLPHIESLTTEFPNDADLVVAFDCGDFKRLGINKGGYKLINIDHHASNDLYGDENIVDVSAPSAASVTIKLLKENGITPTKEAATCLYAALASDTDFFRHEDCGKEALFDAAYLAALGADTVAVSRALNQNESISKLKLHAQALLRSIIDDNTAFCAVSQETLKEFGAKDEEADGIAEKLRSIDKVAAAMVLRETKTNKIRGSIRSKIGVNAHEIAARFGGGGHVLAAGFTIDIKSDFTTDANNIEKIFKQAIKGVL